MHPQEKETIKAYNLNQTVHLDTKQGTRRIHCPLKNTLLLQSKHPETNQNGEQPMTTEPFLLQPLQVVALFISLTSMAILFGWLAIRTAYAMDITMNLVGHHDTITQVDMEQAIKDPLFGFISYMVGPTLSTVLILALLYATSMPDVPNWRVAAFYLMGYHGLCSLTTILAAALFNRFTRTTIRNEDR